MMERLMLDAVALWARAYKVDGFRFDLMGHHMVRNMENVRAVLDALTPEADGVHGAAVLLYGEGWDFGEVADGARGRQRHPARTSRAAASAPSTTACATRCAAAAPSTAAPTSCGSRASPPASAPCRTP
jgi:1,4-alpha-glucan branching enzyme